MKILYLFCESRGIRIPFFAYDKYLFNQLIARGGVWNKEKQEFIFKQEISAEEFSRSITSIPCVCVEEKSPAPLRVFGFFEHQQKQISYAETPFAPAKIDFNISDLNHPPLSEKFLEHWQIKLEAELRSRKYSPRTQRLYLYYNQLLCNTLQKHPEEIQPEDITQFLASTEKSKKYSASSINLTISAIKFFYKNVFRKDIIGEQRRPRHDKHLPSVLAKTEISKIFSTEKNIKHRLLLMLAYSSGLRVSEVVALKKEHIDTARGVIYIKLAKGRRDRCTLLSEKVVRLLAKYCTMFDIKTWLFPGQPATSHLSIRSAQHIFDKAARHAEISKKVSIHSLRHTFATHLLESGTDIRYIQTLLGHSSLRTTERYTHIAKRELLKIRSPLDTIF
ncbi:MAG: site-specific integrase [Spirochaetes bacterium]|nr:site-specific integrase [Spirochaetota bacterium]